MTQYQDLVSIIPWTLIAMIANLLLTVLLVKRFLFKPINEMLEKRKAMADAQIADAEKARKEALDMKAEYEQDLRGAKEEAGEILANARRTATLQGEEILHAASEQAARMKSAAEESIEQSKRKAVSEIRDEIGGLAVEIASKVVERELSDADQAGFIDRFIAQVGTTDAGKGTDA